MKLATVRDGGRTRLVVLARAGGTDVWVDVADAAKALAGDGRCPASLAGLLRRDGPGLVTAARVVEAVSSRRLPGSIRRWAPGEARFAALVPEPGAFLDFFAFEEHVRGARARRGLGVPPEWYERPVYYRSNQRGMQGDGEDVWFPAGETMMDYELELAVVLGAPLESPDARAAGAAIAGYCLLNDWSARAAQKQVMAVGLGPNKGKDFATSLGPWLVTPDEVGDLGAVELAARVNGEEWSRGTMRPMRWGFGELIANAAEGVRFEPGDVFGSGTLGGGCGLELGRFLQPGDRVELDGGALLGTLSGTVRRREG